MPLPSFSGDIEKNIIRHIKYRGTIRTGEIIVDNGDGTYDVKIALSDVVYPSIETIHYEMVFAVGEVAVLAFEYGSKESPKIIGHGKKIAQVPVEVEVDYSGTAKIDIGSPAVLGEYESYPEFTFIVKENPANASGKITSVEIRASVDMPDAKVAIFYRPDPGNYPNKFSTRDTQAIGVVTAGAKRTFDVDLNVQEGDYLGIYFAYGETGIGRISTTLNPVGYWYKAGDEIPCADTTFTTGDGYTISLYGKGIVT